MWGLPGDAVRSLLVSRNRIRRDTLTGSSPPPARAGKQGSRVAGRIVGKKANQDVPTTWQTRQAQYDAVCRWGIPNHSLLQRVSAIDLPVFVANGDSDQ
jgi:hypothetical protein